MQMDYSEIISILHKCKGSLQFVKKIIVWTPKGILIERIYEDTNFTEKVVRKLTKFYVEHMLPEILTRNLYVMFLIIQLLLKIT